MDARLRDDHLAGHARRSTALRNWFDALEAGFQEHGEGRVLPEGAEPVVGFDLTTHAGHFMGSGHNRLVLFTLDGKAYVQAAGTWDPMPWHVDKAYKTAGSEAQHAFWGADDERSMIRQIALARWRDATRSSSGPGRTGSRPPSGSPRRGARC